MPESSKQEAEEQPSSSSSADAYVLRCVIALNAGLAENEQLRGQFNEIASSTQVDRVSWFQDGIPIELAETTIRAKACAYRPDARNRQPSGLRYFDNAVREAHDRAQTRGARPPATRPATSRPRPIRRAI